MEKINFNNKNSENKENLDIEIHTVENTIKEILPIDELTKIFGAQTYLIGGLVRDIILGKNTTHADIDLITKTPIENILEKLNELGFSESKNVKFRERKFSMKQNTNVINLLLNGREIQTGIKKETSIEELILAGDLNLNCCAFDLDSQTILNQDIFKEISNRTLLFCNPELAKVDPMKIISALKLISKMPDLHIPASTIEIITEALPITIDFFVRNPNRRHKLNPLFGNINSGQIIKIFEGFDTKEIFDEINLKKEKLKVPDDYTSCPIEELDDDIRSQITSLIKDKFGKKFDKTKLFNQKVNSVVYKLNNNEDVDACCLIDSERIYLATATNTTQLVKIVSNLCENNYNIWTTISYSHNLLISLSQKAGLHVINDPELVEKILISNYPEYTNQLIIETKRGHTVFTKFNSEDAPQILLTS